MIYFLYRAKDVTKKLVNIYYLSNYLQNRMDNTFMNFINSKTSNPHRLLLNFTEKITLKRSESSAVLSNLSIYSAWKKYKKAMQKQ